MDRSGPRKGWRPRTPPEPLDARLPVPWPEKYLTVFEQPFAPSVFAQNATALSRHLSTRPEDESAASRLAKELHQRLLEHTVSEDDGLLVVYGFPTGYRGIQVEPGWVSAYGNAAAILGSVKLWECFRDEDYLSTAYELFRPLATPRVLREDGPAAPPGKVDADRWISFVDDAGFLWFEEMPLSGHPPPMVLNGHITAVISLYYLYDRGGRDDVVLRLLDAGLASVHRYGPSYRRPGDANRYDLLDPVLPDYSPARSVRQHDALHQMTGAQAFARLRHEFAADWRKTLERQHAEPARGRDDGPRAGRLRFLRRHRARRRSP